MLTVSFEGYEVEVEVTYQGCAASFDHPGDAPEYEIVEICDWDGVAVTEQAMRDELEMSEDAFMGRFDHALDAAMVERMQELEYERAGAMW